MDDLTSRYSVLVSKYAVADHIQSIIDSIETDNKYNEGFADGLEFCIGTLSIAPTVQPEQKKGKWLLNVHGSHGYTCPYCGTHKAFKHNFCPNCGADMRGEQDE